MELQDDQTLLEIQNLTTSFLSDKKWIPAIRNINLSLQKGKTLAIVGESGSGKSVTSLSIMGLLPDKIGKIENGKIIFHHKDLSKFSRKEFREINGNNIAMIFQEPMTSLNPVMKCGKQVAESLINHKSYSKERTKEEVIKLFEQVRLPNPEEIYDRYPHEISGGQKQRVVIALALICSPEVIIADEPTTALDVTVQKEILNLLKEIQVERQIGLIFISHDLDVVKSLAHVIAVMYKGELVEVGETKNILENPKHPYTKGLLHCKPPVDQRPKRLMTIKDFLHPDDAPKIELETLSERSERHSKLYDQEPILQVQNLSKTYTSKKTFFGGPAKLFKAVDGVSFNLYSGETLGLVGESGCGKTTLSRTILKLISPSQGKIIFRGEEIQSLSNKRMRPYRKDIQIVFQDPYSSLNPRKTIGSAIVEPMTVFGLYDSEKERVAKAKELLEKTGLLPEHFDRYPHEFSGGQRQRIVIARTLSLSPALIICDESVSALDVSVQAQVLNLLNDLKDEFNLTYLFISHDMSVVKYMSDRIMVMNKGKIEEISEADQLFENPKSDYTRRLLASIPK